VFDGPEDRNGKRNHDEVRFWVDYVTSNESAAYIYDDQGNRGGLPPGRSFVIMGDLNADVSHGSGPKQAIQALIDHPKINDPKPTSPGAIEQARTEQTRGCATADFSDPNPGNLRADYVLPSAVLTLQSSGVFWPNSQHPLARLVQMRPEPATSDHRLVWIDVSPP
jgi:endonuclease/exonuclease/phosphatase family metal-dependent hydrolase